MESEAKENAFKKMSEDSMPFRVQEHVVANLMQAYMTVTNTTYAKELQNTPMNYWSGDDLFFTEDNGREFDSQLEMERNMEAYSKSKPIMPETVRNSKRRFDSITSDPMQCYATKAPSDAKEPSQEDMDDQSNDEGGEDCMDARATGEVSRRVSPWNEYRLWLFRRSPGMLAHSYEE